MANTGSDSANKPVVSDAVREEAHVYEDEINLMDYFLVLWKHKWLILVCSVLPALIVALVIYRSPRSYKVTYMSNKVFTILLCHIVQYLLSLP